MATNFPTSLDDYTTLVDNTDQVLAAHNNDIADAIEALQVKVGIDNSAVTSTHDYLMSNIPAQDTTAEVTNLNVALLNGGSGSQFFVFRSGDIIVSSNTTTPSAWTAISTSYEDRFMRLSSSTPLVTAGSDTHDHGGATQSHTLTISELPAHDHTYQKGVQVGEGDGLSTKNNGFTTATTSSTGGGGGHTHSMTSNNNVPAYIQLRAYQKD